METATPTVKISLTMETATPTVQISPTKGTATSTVKISPTKGTATPVYHGFTRRHAYYADETSRLLAAESNALQPRRDGALPHLTPTPKVAAVTGSRRGLAAMSHHLVLC